MYDARNRPGNMNTSVAALPSSAGVVVERYSYDTDSRLGKKEKPFGCRRL
jgi:hypothetical protein